MNTFNVIWLMFQEMERDQLGSAIEYVEPRNGYKDRAEAATAILEDNLVSQDPRNPARFIVQSQEHGVLQSYEVIWGEPPSCTCDDHQKDHTIYCKHVLSARRVYYLQRAWAKAALEKAA